MNFLKKLVTGYDRLEEGLLVFSLAFNVVVIFTQIILRTGFNSGLTWVDELTRYIFIWQIWLGTSTAVRTDQHINVTMILNFVKNPRAQAVIKLVGLVIWFLFSGYLMILGYQVVASMIARKVASTILRIPMWIIYGTLSISSLLVCVRLIAKIVKQAMEVVHPVVEGGVAE